MPHLPPAHRETSKRDSPDETKVKKKQNKTILDLNSNLAKSMTHHNQTNELITWFLRREDGDNESLKYALIGKVLSPLPLHISMITPAMRPRCGDPYRLKL
jgi:hypothetical protein